MAVEHDVRGAALGGLNNVDDKRTATLGLENLLGNTLDLKHVDVVVNELHALLDLAIGQELGIVVG